VTYFNQRFRNLIEYSGTPRWDRITVNYLQRGPRSRMASKRRRGRISRPPWCCRSITRSCTPVSSSQIDGPQQCVRPGKPLIRRPAHTLAPQLSATSVTAGASTWRAVGWQARRCSATRVTLQPYTRVNVSGEYTLGRVILSGEWTTHSTISGRRSWIRRGADGDARRSRHPCR